MTFVNPRKTPFVPMKSRGELPHLYKPGGTYFVTFRLWDAVTFRTRPTTPNRSSTDVEPDDLARDYDPPLTLGSCVLGRPEVAQLVADAITSGTGDRYDLHAWCVMPNHVHAVFAPLVPYRFQQVMQSWKGGSSRRVNQVLARTGPLWERESFDHLIRSTESLGRFVRYVEDNPVIAGLVTNASEWQFGSRWAGSAVPEAVPLAR
jgi:REP element-mobilizing transposase RayT